MIKKGKTSIKIAIIYSYPQYTQTHTFTQPHITYSTNTSSTFTSRLSAQPFQLPKAAFLQFSAFEMLFILHDLIWLPGDLWISTIRINPFFMHFARGPFSCWYVLVCSSHQTANTLKRGITFYPSSNPISVESSALPMVRMQICFCGTKLFHRASAWESSVKDQKPMKLLESW